MSYYKILAFGIIGLIGSVLLKRIKEEYSLFLTLGVSLLLTLSAVGIIAPVAEYITGLSEQKDIGEYISVIFKASGICIITSLSSDMCRDSGESALGAKIDLCGKCTILYMALPLLKTVFESSLKIIG